MPHNTYDPATRIMIKCGCHRLDNCDCTSCQIEHAHPTGIDSHYDVSKLKIIIEEGCKEDGTLFVRQSLNMKATEEREEDDF